MAHILIVYESKYGQTEKISRFIADKINSRGHSVDLLEAHAKSTDLSPYQTVIVGGPVYANGYPRALSKWVKHHSDALNIKPTAFFSVCLGVMQKDQTVQRSEAKIVQGFFRKTNWLPKKWVIFAGALNYSRYGWFTKRIMHNIAKRAGADTDWTRDYEYTDWKEVSQFADDVLAVQNEEPVNMNLVF
nr:hypothetical protein BdHM001_11430 [Bdellovibrio sp. HM001]